MNDVKYINNDYQFIARTSALIFNKSEDKVLLFNVEGRNFYLLPGGKVHELEESKDALKRVLKEELSFANKSDSGQLNASHPRKLKPHLLLRRAFTMIIEKFKKMFDIACVFFNIVL